MNRTLHRLAGLGVCLTSGSLVAETGYVRPVAPFPGAAETQGSDAVQSEDPAIRGWAMSVVDYQIGEEVPAELQFPEKALGPVDDPVESVVTLGRGGQITLRMEVPVRDIPGPDLVVFENAFNNTFLELAWVEISSDGVHFARFPNYSWTLEPVGAFGSVDPKLVKGLAGKYRQGYGTPFDLANLRTAYLHALTKETWEGPAEPEFSQNYRDALVANFGKIHFGAIRYVRIVDIVGDGTALDSEGFAIFDPYPTLGTAGFDLAGVGVVDPQGQISVTWQLVETGLRLQLDVGSLGTGGWQLMGSTDCSIWNALGEIAVEVIPLENDREGMRADIPLSTEEKYFRWEQRP